MKNLTRIVGVGLLALLVGCQTPKSNQERSKDSQKIELSPREARIDGLRLSFNRAYELAIKAHESYLRNREGTGAIDRFTAERSLEHYEDLVGDMNGCIDLLEKSGDDVSDLEGQVSGLPQYK